MPGGDLTEAELAHRRKVGEWITANRRQAGLTRDDLAGRIGSTAQELRALEDGEGDASALLPRIAQEIQAVLEQAAGAVAGPQQPTPAAGGPAAGPEAAEAAPQPRAPASAAEPVAAFEPLAPAVPDAAAQAPAGPAAALEPALPAPGPAVPAPAPALPASEPAVQPPAGDGVQELRRRLLELEAQVAQQAVRIPQLETALLTARTDLRERDARIADLQAEVAAARAGAVPAAGPGSPDDTDEHAVAAGPAVQPLQRAPLAGSPLPGLSLPGTPLPGTPLGDADEGWEGAAAAASAHDPYDEEPDDDSDGPSGRLLLALAALVAVFGGLAYVYIFRGHDSKSTAPPTSTHVAASTSTTVRHVTPPHHTVPVRTTPRKPRPRPLLPPARTPVLVLNGNGVAGAAGREAAKVRGAGYPITSVTNAPRQDYPRTLVLYRAPLRPEALRLAARLAVPGRVAVVPAAIDPRTAKLVVLVGRS